MAGGDIADLICEAPPALAVGYRRRIERAIRAHHADGSRRAGHYWTHAPLQDPPDVALIPWCVAMATDGGSGMDPFAGAGIEAAKPVIRVVSDIYQTGKQKRQFKYLLERAIQLNAVDTVISAKIAAAVIDKLDDARKNERRGKLKGPRWWGRRDRGPGVNRLSTRKFADLLDSWYKESASELNLDDLDAVSENFIKVVIDTADGLGPGSTYASSLLDAFRQNDDRFQHWGAWTTAAGGLAATGTAAALATGVKGAMDVDLKTALTILVGTLITSGITALVQLREKVRTRDHPGGVEQPK